MGIWDKVQNTVGGTVAGNFFAGAPGAAVGALKGGKTIESWNPYVQGPRKAREASKKANELAQNLYQQTQPLNQKLNTADDEYLKSFGSRSKDYLDSAKRLTDDYLGSLGQLEDEARSQANDARLTYKGSILPELKSSMSRASTNASQAMSLAEAGDPNNPIMRAVRDLYDQQGKAVRTQGQQDYGILSALGAQAAQGQFGAGGPMTSGQMGQIYAANQGQANDAYARAQQRMFDLQQQGIDRGFDQSNQIYQFGQDAQDRLAQRIRDLQAGEENFSGLQGRFRDELSGYAGDRMGVGSGLNTDRFNIGRLEDDIRKGNIYAGTGRDQQALDRLFGVQSQNINNELAAILANENAKAQFFQSALGGAAKLGAAAAGAPA